MLFRVINLKLMFLFIRQCLKIYPYSYFSHLYIISNYFEISERRFNTESYLKFGESTREKRAGFGLFAIISRTQEKVHLTLE